MSKDPRSKERVISMRHNLKQPYVEVFMEHATVYFPKNEVVAMLKKELRSALTEGRRRPKERVLSLMTEEKQNYKITSPAQVDELEEIRFIIDKLLTKGKAIVLDKDMNPVEKIRMKEEFLLYGSYEKSFILPDGKQIIVTEVRFGE